MEKAPPHVLIIPFPAQGHVKPMFMLAQLLAEADFQVSFVNTQHNHPRLLDQIDHQSFFARFPKFQFHTIPDGLPDDHARSGVGVGDLLISTSMTCKPHFKELVTKISIRENGEWDPPACIISDGVMLFDMEVGEELEIPILAYRACNATCAWIYSFFEKLIEAGEIPVNENDEDADRVITLIPGLETVIRRRDLPSICRLEADHPTMQYFLKATSKMRRVSALILNTFEALEKPMVSHLRSVFPNVYTIGPLYDLLKSRAENCPLLAAGSSNGSLIQPDRTSITWLDSQPARSVVFVSFGSVSELTQDELLEVWHGLVNSGKPFLLVMRSDLMKDIHTVGSDQVPVLPPEVVKGTYERGCIVKWVPQEEVLTHPALGAFFTHAGWNSVLESTSVGVPMICWPQLADHQVNSRCVGAIWNNGLEMKDMCDRATIEKMVRDLMEGRREDIVEAATELGSKARESVRPGGSSYNNIDKLIEDIRAMKSTNKCRFKGAK